eukprot:1882587-Amphidinium_carterae.8
MSMRVLPRHLLLRCVSTLQVTHHKSVSAFLSRVSSHPPRTHKARSFCEASQMPRLVPAFPHVYTSLYAKKPAMMHSANKKPVNTSFKTKMVSRQEITSQAKSTWPTLQRLSVQLPITMHTRQTPSAQWH